MPAPKGKALRVLRRRRGFTALEVAVAIGTGLTLLALFGYMALASLHSWQLTGALETARTIADAAELWRKSASTSTVTADTGIYTGTNIYLYTYNSISGSITAAAFNSATGLKGQTTTPWGSNFTVSGGAAGASVQFTAPYDLGGNPIDGVRTVLGAGSYQYTVYPTRAEARGNSGRLRSWKAEWYLENTR